MDISYIACSRPDIAAGNFDSSISTWVQSSPNIYNIYQNISRTLPKNSYFVAAFISGFSTASSSFDITINNKAYDVNKNSVVISFYCFSNPPVMTITISYIIYPVIHPIFNFYFELVPKKSDSSYQFSGPVNFLYNNSITYNEWGIGSRYFSCVGSNCPT
jgi:hypothetical protein